MSEFLAEAIGTFILIICCGVNAGTSLSVSLSNNQVIAIVGI